VNCPNDKKRGFRKYQDIRNTHHRAVVSTRKYVSGQCPNEHKLAKPNTPGAKGRHATTHATTIDQKRRRQRSHTGELPTAW